MSFRIESVARNSSFATPGETYVILASSASLRKHLTDSYWYEAMEEVCEGKLQGVAVRYTGENLLLLQFRPTTLSPAGYRYPLYMSIPIEFMVPVGETTVHAANTDPGGSFGTATTGSIISTNSSEDSKLPGTLQPLPKLCVVCGRYNMPGMVQRPHGWKCKECKGIKSVERLRNEAKKLQSALKGE